MQFTPFDQANISKLFDSHSENTLFNSETSYMLENTNAHMYTHPFLLDIPLIDLLLICCSALKTNEKTLT